MGAPGPTEERLAQAERLTEQAGWDQQRIHELNAGNQQYIEDWTGFSPAGAAGGTSITVNRTIGGCFGSSNPLAGATLTITDDTTATVVGSATSSGAGVASVTFTGDVTHSYSAKVSYPPRFAPTTTSGLTFAAGTNTLATGALTAASPYICSGLCNIPLKQTLYAFDSVYGDTITLTWQPTMGSAGRYFGCAMRAVPRARDCTVLSAAIAANVPLRYWLDPDQSLGTGIVVVIDAVDGGTCNPCWKAVVAGNPTILDCSNCMGVPGGPDPIGGFDSNPGQYGAEAIGSTVSGPCFPTNLTTTGFSDGFTDFTTGGPYCASSEFYPAGYPTLTITE